jgi:hypothetical protein
MNWFQFILDLIQAFAVPQFGSAQAVAKLGPAVQKQPYCWTLQPTASELAGAQLELEDLAAGKGLLTTVSLTLKTPWKTSFPELQKHFGAQFNWMPTPDRGRPRVLQFNWKVGQTSGVLIFDVAQRSQEAPEEECVVLSATLRRFFPTKPPAPEQPKKSAP